MNLKHRLIAFGLALACSLPAQAAMQPDLSSLNAVPRHAAAQTTVAKALAQVAGKKSQPLRFAVLADLPVTLDGGLWDQAPDDRARWRSRVSSTGAVAIGLEFSRFALPTDAELWIYDAQGQLVQGPYTQRDQTPEGRLWTALVPGDEAVIELRVPQAQKSAVLLELGKLSHAYLDISKAAIDAPAKSASCNIDSICSDGDNWRSEIRSVALLSIGNEVVCSGQLVNNALQNKSPLLLTANHCEIGQDYPASSVVTYWNYQTSSCGRAVPNGSLSQSTSGSTLLAGDVGTDFTLVRLNSTPPASYNVYYAGWDAGSAAPQSGVAIHHPAGDEKRISTYTSAASAQTVCIDGDACTRRVRTWQVNWARGTTEPGSSGGGLWNQNHRIVGVLSGGDASCTNTGGNDYFARLTAAYQANTASSGQLKAWLDPSNAGITRLNGLDSTETGSAVTQNPAESYGTVDDGDGGGGGSLDTGLLAGLALLGLLRRRLASITSRRACRA